MHHLTFRIPTLMIVLQRLNILLCFLALGLTLDGMYKSLNRTVLYQLSRPINSLADQTNILDALHKLTTNRSLILGPGNYDQEFIGCLCYCLLQLTGNTAANIQ
jgi:hypothetical protein